MKWLSIKKNDLLLIVPIVIICIALLVVLNIFAKKGNTVTVYYDGETVAEYSLDEELSTLIETGENKEFQNEILITDGKVTVSSANCRDQICVHHSSIQNEGESIICLPHKLVVAITDGE